MTAVVAVARLGLAGVLLVAAVGKLLDLPGARRALTEFEVPKPLVGSGAVMLVLAEMASAIGLVFQPTARWAGIAAGLLFMLFTIGIARALQAGRAPECHCFGQFHSQPAGARTLVRNAVLLAVAVLTAVIGPGKPVDRLVDAHSRGAGIAGLVGALALLLGGAIVWLQVVNQRLRSRATQSAPTAAPVGAPAPPFALEDGANQLVTSADLVASGTPVLLLFTSVICAQCQAFMPDLVQWQRRLAGRLRIVPLCFGDRASGLAHAFEHGVADTLFLGEDRGLIDLYGIPVTPCGLLIGSGGRVASAPIQGADAIDALLEVIAGTQAAADRSVSATAGLAP